MSPKAFLPLIVLGLAFLVGMSIFAVTTITSAFHAHKSATENHLAIQGSLEEAEPFDPYRGYVHVTFKKVDNRWEVQTEGYCEGKLANELICRRVKATAYFKDKDFELLSANGQVFMFMHWNNSDIWVPIPESAISQLQQ